MIKIAIDSQALSTGHSVRGIGMMVQEEVKALNELKGKDIKLEVFNFNTKDGKWKLENGKYDIVHYPYFFPYTLTLPSEKFGKKNVVTIQDLIQLVYPKIYPPGIRGKINFQKQRMRLKDINAVVTISETSKKDIIRFLGLSPQKIHVIYLAAKEVFKPISNRRVLGSIIRKYKLPNKFALYVGDVNYNKNIESLVFACKKAKIPLVMCGKQAKDVDIKGLGLDIVKGPRDYLRYLMGIPHPELAHFEKLSQIFSSEKFICRLGFVSDTDLAVIYNLAAVYVQPSFYEGFGLPVLEAMSSNCPVVVSRTNALVEVVEDAGLIANSGDIDDLAEKMYQVVNNSSLRAELIKKGMKRARFFSWKKTAKEILYLYKSLLKE